MKIRLCSLLTAVLAASAAYANTFTFVTPTGATIGGRPVDASATLTTGAGAVAITLTNLEANPTDVTQLISDFDFVLSAGAATGGLSSSSTNTIIVNGDGTTTPGSFGVSTGWQLTSNGSGGFLLNALVNGGQPLILGPPGPGGVYTDGNGSIAGNPGHNPFSNGSAAFNLAVSGVTSNTSVTSATFSFGTTAGLDTPGIPSSTVPEPFSVLLLASVIGGLFVSLRKRFA